MKQGGREGLPGEVARLFSTRFVTDRTEILNEVKMADKVTGVSWTGKKWIASYIPCIESVTGLCSTV